MTEANEGLSHAIAEEPGLLWKIWTENEAAGEAGGINLFKDAASAKASLIMTRHASRASELPR